MTRKRRKQRPAPRGRSRRPAGGPSIVTPEGDPLVSCTAVYGHSGTEEVLTILRQARDFEVPDVAEPGPEGAFHVLWYGTTPGSPPPVAPIGRRLVASLTLAHETMEVTTMSEPRMARCRRRLERLLGERIQLLRTEAKSMQQALAEARPEDEPDPLILPPEAIADLEERMLQQWIDESIPALDGMTPREAVRTPEGRQKVLDLLEYIERDQSHRRLPPGMFTPDYNKVKEMLGLD